ncbi:MAG TPA: glycosyltransferase [Terriglobia bacterium]|nr:glycosyltransferase [Terriglobia bacterium]
MPVSNLRVSIVINTYNRATSLDTTLQSLRRLNYPWFEVVVVNGPSPDHTSEVLEKHRAHIRVGTCSERNLSVSRNVGIEMAHGELVGFMDDDAVPDENWLDDIVAAFDSDDVGAAGGIVYNHTGYDLQYRYSLCNRLGNPRWNVPFPGGEFCYPGCLEFPYLQGTNAVYRRSALMEVGGWDEEFGPYLDETDVCMRLIDAGYLLKQLSNAFVYHRFLPSDMRGASRATTNYRPVIKGKIYFSLKNSPPGTSTRTLVEDWKRSIDEWEATLRHHIAQGIAPQEAMEQFQRDADLATREGIEHGLVQPRRFIGSPIARQLRGSVAFDVLDPAYAGTFKPCTTLLPKSERLTVCYLSQTYPPSGVGGICRLTYDLANGLAACGHNVHVLTRSTASHNTVDFEEGVWVHRLAMDQEEPSSPPGIVVPKHIWQFSARMLRELKRIQQTHAIDIVEAPIWDAEGIAPIVDGSFRMVTSLHTSIKTWIKTNSELVTGTAEQQRFFEELIAAETLVTERAHGLRANSQAIVEIMQESYGIQFRPGQLLVVPHGMEDRSRGKLPAQKKDTLDVLFAGRFERRKGIDVLLKIIPALCLKYPKVRFILVGEDRPQPDGTTRAGLFRARHGKAPFRNQVIFTGKISDAELENYLAQCDIFAAPSLFESFGLVFLEAMMFSKPVVGCRAGGMKEVIEDGVTGILAEPGNAESLRTALATLIADPAKREAMGKAGRERFLAHYTREGMTERTLNLYRHVLKSTTAKATVMPPPRVSAELMEAAH